MARYFDSCTTAEELKQEYKKQARLLHPDCNPGRDTTAEFQRMQAEFETAFSRLKSVHVNAQGERYEKATEETAQEYMDMISKLLRMPGVNTELCGSWLWCTGNTKAHKEELKAMGFKWSNGKKAWSFHYEPWRRRSRRSYSLDEIRGKYGSVRFRAGKSESRTEEGDPILTE